MHWSFMSSFVERAISMSIFLAKQRTIHGIIGKIIFFLLRSSFNWTNTIYQTITKHRKNNGKINLKNGINSLAWQRIVEIAVQEKPFVTLVIIIKSFWFLFLERKRQTINMRKLFSFSGKFINEALNMFVVQCLGWWCVCIFCTWRRNVDVGIHTQALRS